MTPHISVLLPAYNAGATLALTLRSVARQTETRFECIIIDDGSHDDTAAIAQTTCASDSRFRLLRRPHQGLVPALNAGLEVCRGRLIARMDGDDIMHRQRLQLQQQALADTPTLAGVGCHVRLFPRTSIRQGLRHYERWLNSMQCAADIGRDRYIECPLAHPSFTFRRQVFRQYGYRDMGWPEDYDLVLRMLADGHALGIVPRRLLLWRDHPRRLSRNDQRYRIECFTACRAHYLAAGFLRHHDRYVLWGYGGTGKALRKALVRYDKRPAVIVELHPGRIG